MAVAKLTASGRAVQIILDDGTVLQTSRYALDLLVKGQAHGGLVVFTRMPYKVADDRFPKSPVFGEEKPEEGSVDISKDALNKRVRESRKQVTEFQDKMVF